MRVLHLGKYFYPERGGIENYTLALAKEAKKAGNEVFVIVSNTTRRFIHEKIMGIEVFRLPRIFHFLRLPVTVSPISLVRKIKPDIIHLHVPNPWFELNLFLYYIFSKNLKIIVTYHSDVVWYTQFHFLGECMRRLYLIPLLKFSKKIVATSKNYAEYSPVLKWVKDKIVIIPLGVDEKIFRPRKVKKIKKHVLLFVGRLVPYKGVEHLLKAAKILSEKRRDFILLIVGNGKLKRKLEKITKKLSIERFVKFVGGVSEEDVIKYYNLCDIFILPSVHRSEAFGISQLEAMACGKPVISTNIKGSAVPWVNQHMRTGIVVEPKNPKALSDAILLLLRSERMRKIMGKNARLRVLKYFTTSKMLRKTLSVYKSI